MAAAHKGVVPPAVFGKVNDADPGVICRYALQDFEHIVGRTVIDCDNLIIEIGLLCHNFADLVDDEPHGALAGIAGDDKTDDFLFLS